MASTSLVARLMATLGLNRAEFTKGIVGAKSDLQGLAQSAQRVGTSLKAALGLTVAGIGLQQVISIARQTVTSVASIGDEAKRSGLSAQAFQEWKYVAEQNRIGIDAMVDGFKELSLRADEFVVTGGGSAAEAFTRLGFTAGELQKKLKDPSALMLEIIGRMKGLDKAAQIRVSDEIFGGTGGERFVEIIDQGAEGIRKTIGQAHALGAVIDQDVIAKAAQIDAKFAAMTTSVTNWFKASIVNMVAAGVELTDLRATLDEIFTDEGEARRVLGDGVVDALAKDRTALEAVAHDVEAVKAEYDQLGYQAIDTANKMADFVSQLRGMGFDAQAAVIQTYADRLRETVEKFVQGEISGDRFASKMGEIQAESQKAFAALNDVDGVKFDGARAELGRLGTVIQTVTGWAQKLRDAMPGAGANMDSGTGLSSESDIYDLMPPTDLAPKSSPKPKSAPAMIHEIGDKAIEAGGKGGGGGKGKTARLDDYARSVQSIKEETAALEAEAIAFAYVATSGIQYADAVEYARTRAALLAAAQRAGTAITPELTAEIDAMALAYTNAGHAAEEAAERMRKVEEDGARGADAIGGIFTAALQGSKAAKAAVAQLLLEIAKAQMMKAATGLFGGSGVSKLLGGLIGANSMGTNDWRGGLTRINELGGEIVDLPEGSKIIPHDISKRIADKASGGSGGGMNVHVTVGLDADANLQVKSISQQQVADGLRAYDQNMPQRLQQIADNPRRR